MSSEFLTSIFQGCSNCTWNLIRTDKNNGSVITGTNIQMMFISFQPSCERVHNNNVQDYNQLIVNKVFVSCI